MIKVIATDMDGTFLRSTNTYNESRFDQLLTKMTEQGVRFVVASGNQYAQLRDFFPDKDDKITYVSENGALITQGSRQMVMGAFTNETVQSILDCLAEYETDGEQIELLLCGVKAAYIKQNASQRFKEFAAIYYHALTVVDDFVTVPDDQIVKIALDVTLPNPRALVDHLNDQLTGQIVAVSSGHGSIDIMVPGINKGTALMHLLTQWQLAHHHLAAFGDSDNDAEMLALTPHSYAMTVHSEHIGATAKHVIGSNETDAVLDQITKILETQEGCDANLS